MNRAAKPRKAHSPKSSLFPKRESQHALPEVELPDNGHEHNFGGPRTILGVSIAILFALNLWIFRDHWRGLTSFPFDFVTGYYAFTAYWIASVQAGEWPHWIPYQSFGYPAALNPQLGMFYPPFWIFVVFRLPYTLHAANILQALHVLFGSVGFLLLARRCLRSSAAALCGAVSFGLFGGFYTNAEHPDIIRAFAWTPWLFWALLLDEGASRRRFLWHEVSTKLRTRNMLLPFIVYCLVTGSYPGLIVSGLAISVVFVTSQTAALYPRDRSAIVDGLIQGAQILAGVGMSMILILPTSAMSAELTRSEEYRSIAHVYLRFVDFFHLFLPSNVLSAQDYSMFGMQLPVVLLLFVPFARLRASISAPVLATAAFASMMCLQELAPVSGLIHRLAPATSLSRFPVGDYRLFICLAVLLCALSGMEGLFESRTSVWQRLGVMLAALAGLIILCAYLLATLPQLLDARVLAAWIFRDGIYCALAIAGYLLFVQMKWSGSMFAVVTAFAGMFMMLPVLQQMKMFWNDRIAEESTYWGQRMPLTGRDGRLRVEQLFSRREIARRRREKVDPRQTRFFSGYIEGNYMTSDVGGARSISLQKVELDPALQSIMLQPSKLVGVPCLGLVCENASPVGVSLTGPPGGQAAEYSRNYVVYEVDAPVQSLLVENEIYAPGWSGYCETHGEHVDARRVNGALRGWVLGPGRHRLRVSYRTPLLSFAGFSSIAFTGLCALSVILWRRSAHAPASPANMK